MKLFDAVHPDIFTILASPNKELYADALEVLYEAYHDNDLLRIPESKLYSMLRGKLERQLAEADFEGEDIEEEELRDISGRTRFLMRKLCSRGWYEKERGKDFEENIIVPLYSSKLLELFNELTIDDIMRGYSYVFDTYSSLKVAWDGENIFDKMNSIYSAYDNTKALINLLRSVYHNVKRFFQIQITLQNINDVLASHFDDFGQKIIEAYIRPLKIRDSVPKFRVPIQDILNGCIENDVMLLAISNAAFQDKRMDSIERCRADILQKIHWVKEQYGRIENDYLDEIDDQVRRYTRATTLKIENLTNRDQNTKGNLNYLLTELSQKHSSGKIIDAVAPVFHLLSQSFISEKSLWFRRQPVKYEKKDTVTIDDEELSDKAKIEAINMLSHKFSKAAVAEYMEVMFKDTDIFYTNAFDLTDDFTFIMSLLSVLNGNEPESFYSVDKMDGDYVSKPYQIPQLRFKRK